MDIKDAYKRAKSEAVFFWLVDKAADGKPKMLLDKKRIAPEELAQTVKTAKSKAVCKGRLAVDDANILTVTPRGKVPANLTKNIMVLTHENHLFPKQIVIAAAEPDEDDASPAASEQAAPYVTSLDVHASEDGAEKAVPAEPPSPYVTSLGLEASGANAGKSAAKPSAAPAAAGPATQAAPPRSRTSGPGELPLSKKYQDEDKKLAWKVENLPAGQLEDLARQESLKRSREAGKDIVVTPAEMREHLRELTSQRTKYFSDEERRKAAVSFDATGAASMEGGPLAAKMGAVMRPEDEKLHVFNAVRVKEGGVTLDQHHSSPLAGGAVLGAGHVKVEEGHITEVDDQSGHYKPGAAHTHQMVEALDAQGGLVDRRIRDERKYPLSASEYAALSPVAAKAFRDADDAKRQAYENKDPGRRDALLKAEVASERELERVTLAEFAKLSPEEIKAKGLQHFAPMNREAKVSLLDKRSGMTDEEFARVAGDPAAAARQLKLNQLKGPLGNEAFAKIVKKLAEARQIGKRLTASDLDPQEKADLQKRHDAVVKTFGGDSIDSVLKHFKVGSIDELKLRLGTAELSHLEMDEARLEALFKEHDVQDIKIGPDFNQVSANFAVGQANSLNLTKSQFLETAGNEDQARAKKRMQADLVRKVKDGDQFRPKVAAGGLEEASDGDDDDADLLMPED